jgi:hypothetical protein
LPKVCFPAFLAFGSCRKPVFLLFLPSATAESLFFYFFYLRQLPKACFSAFPAFGSCREPVFFNLLSLRAAGQSLFLEGFEPFQNGCKSK